MRSKSTRGRIQMGVNSFEITHLVSVIKDVRTIKNLQIY